jgi:archaeal arginyl aminopeptidase
MKALFISAEGFDDAELLFPYYRFLEEGMTADIASMRKKTPIEGKHGYKATVTKTLAEINPDDYDILVLPGGYAPEAVRKDPRALELARDFFAKNKPVAAICHGVQTLISAGLMKGRRATGAQAVVDELNAAGASCEYREVVVDGNLVTSRRPSDLPAFMREIMKMARKTDPELKKAA